MTGWHWTLSLVTLSLNFFISKTEERIDSLLFRMDGLQALKGTILAEGRCTIADHFSDCHHSSMS